MIKSKVASPQWLLVILAVAVVSVLFVVACGDGEVEPTAVPEDTGAAEAAAEAAEAAIAEAVKAAETAAMAAEEAAAQATELAQAAAAAQAAAMAAEEAAGAEESEAVMALQAAAAQAVAAAEAAAAMAAGLAEDAAAAEAGAAAIAARLAAAAAAAEAAAAAAADGPKYGGRLTVTVFPSSGSLDPPFMIGEVDLIVTQQVYDNLLMIQPDFSMKPELATSWEPNDDLTSYTFHLRKGVKFHHGKDFKAEDVVFTVNRMLDPERDPPSRNIFKVIKEMVVLDDYTIRFDLDGPNGLLPIYFSNIAARILPSDVDEERLVLEEFGTGPFMIVENLPNERVTMVRNPDYWEEGKPYLDEMVLLSIPEEAARVEALKNGDVDLIYGLGAQNLPSVEAHPETTALRTASAGWIGFYMDVTQEPFDNKLVRKAVQAATDRESINQAALLGLGIPAFDHPIHPSDPVFAPQYAPPPYDPELARSLLEQAGYPDGIDITMYTSDIGPGLIEMAVAFQESAAPAGIRVEVERVPSSDYFVSYWNFVPMATTYWTGQAVPDRALTSQTHSGSPYNAPKYVNPELDALIELARSQTLEDQKVTYAEVQRILIEDVPRIEAAFQPWILGVRANVRGIEVHPLGTPIYQDAWLEP